MTVRDLLLEIGVEELPSSFVESALQAFPGLIQKRLAELRLTHGTIRALGTPRRLAVLIEAVSTHQPDLSEEVTGPPASAAFDKEGKPTRAAEAFAKKLGIEVSALRTVETPKGAYLAGTRSETGKPAAELLPSALAAVCAQLPFRKVMRWGNGDGVAFGRPVRWLVALLGRDVLPVSFAGLNATRTTFGHRFLAPEPIELESPAQYESTLKHAHVWVCPESRRTRMIERLHEAAKDSGGALIEDEFLVGENLSLVEEPHVVVGGFEKRFLELPEEVILEVARGHQRYFGIRGADKKLQPHYLAVVNTAIDPANIRAGNDRVMRARLSDAQFFFDEDRKIKLEDRTPKLDGIVFHHRLGTVGAKVKRVVALTEDLGRLLGLSSSTIATAVRGAALAKCDLVSLMVGEFPELQGVMGRAYALAQGEPANVAEVIKDHYAPKGAHDAIATTDEGALVGLADRLDSLVGCFAIGLTPTGAADPFGLRRACLGIIRTLIGRSWDISISEAFGAAYDRIAAQGVKLELNRDDCLAKLGEFFRDRLRGALSDDTPHDVVEACLAVSGDNPVDAQKRARALVQLNPGIRAKVGEVFKRATNIAKDAPEGLPVAPSALEASPHETEIELAIAIDGLRVTLSTAGESRDYPAAFSAIAGFAPLLDKYFLDIFVMTDVVALRENRLRMMRVIRDVCSAIAHVQLLQG
ncbi:MAG: glycine--tRNA ligase subunit beta [Polyangiaceae bacterium]